jgi:hypothetical protein
MRPTPGAGRDEEDCAASSPRFVYERPAMRSGSTASLMVPRAALLIAVGAVIAAVPRPARALWGGGRSSRSGVVRSMPPDQSWLQDVPEKPGARSKGKIAVFPFAGDDVYEPMRAEVVGLLRGKGFTVFASLRPVDSVAQLREMSVALGLGAIIDGTVKGDGPRESAHIQVRSGGSGQPIATVTFSGSTPKIVAAIRRGFWGRFASSIQRGCAGGKRARRFAKEPLRIDASSPSDSPVASRQP